MEGAKTIKVENGELYVIDDKIVGRMEIDGNVTKYYRGDKLHRDGDLPAHIERNNAGTVTCEIYYRDGKQHRDGDLPAYIRRNDAQCFAKQSINGAVTCESYWRDGKRHRDGDLPAYIKRNGALCFEEHYRDGEYHRDGDLPARIMRNGAGVVTFEEYYRDGVQITPADIKMAKLAQELAAANETIEKLRARMQKILALVE